MFGQPAEGYGQLLGKGIPKSDAYTMSDIYKESKKNFPFWVEVYQSTRSQINTLSAKSIIKNKMDSGRITAITSIKN